MAKDERPQSVTLEGPVEIRITNELLPFLQTLMGPDGLPTPAAGSGGGTLLTEEQVFLWDYTGNVRIKAAGEPGSGEARVLGVAYNAASAPVEVLAEDAGELRVAPVGLDEAGNFDNLRTDPNRIPWQRSYDEWIDVNPAEIPVAEGNLWAPGLADTVRYGVEFLVVNNDAGSAAITGVYVGRDVDAGGALAAPEYWMFNETVPHPGTSGWRGPFYMHGDDAIRGVAGVVNDASIHFRVKRVDVGA